MGSTHRQNGFTLMELLVVIAVMAILAAILFPVIAHAREKARQSACLSNLKQIGLAILMYADDYDGRHPAGSNPSLWVPGPEGSWKRMPTWQGDVSRQIMTPLLLPYVNNPQVFLCPSDPNGDRFSRGGNDRHSTVLVYDPRLLRIAYSGHSGLMQGYSWPTRPKGQPSSTGQPIVFAEISKPALLRLVWDEWIGTHAMTGQPNSRPDLIRWNVCFADGHARYARYVLGLTRERDPHQWNWYNPRHPVSEEKACSPTCAEEGLRD
jgi:prepilin-type N-terminal cleavage/methylation domain-containing protein